MFEKVRTIHIHVNLSNDFAFLGADTHATTPILATKAREYADVGVNHSVDVAMAVLRSCFLKSSDNYSDVVVKVKPRTRR